MRHPWISVAVKAAITLSLLGWLLDRIELRPLLVHLGSVDPWLAAAATALMMAQLLVTGWRWSLVQSGIHAPLNGDAVLRLTMIGQFFNQTLPSAIGGDAVRAWLASREGIPVGKAIAGVLADRLIALAILVAIVGATLPLFHARVPDPALRMAAALIVAATVAGVALFALLGSRLTVWLGRYRRAQAVAQLAHDFRGLIAASPQTSAIIAISVVVHLAVIGSVWLLARALMIDVSAVDCLVIVPPIVLLTTLPVSIAGWGVRESATVIGFGFLGVAPAEALALSVAFGLVQIAIGVPGGVAWLVRRRPGAGRVHAGEAGEPPRVEP